MTRTELDRGRRGRAGPGAGPGTPLPAARAVRLLATLLIPLGACGRGEGDADTELRPAYQVIGMTDDGAGYVARMEVEPAGADRYDYRVEGGEGVVRGTLVQHGDSITLRSTAPAGTEGEYGRFPDGRLEGRWRSARGPSGWEVLRPFAATAGPAVVESYEPAAGTIRIGPGPDDLFPRTDRGYTLLRPGASPVAVAVFFDGFRVRDVAGPPVERSFEDEALRARVAVLRVTTGDPLDFLFEDASVDSLLARIGDALTAHGLDGAPLLFTGMSLAGTRAARAAIRLRRTPDRHPALHLRALAVVDAPLDMARLHRAEVEALREDFHPAAAGEARWVTYRLESALGGSPDGAPEAYRRYSPVSADVPDGGNVTALAGLPVRAYHEPDIDWWLERRGKNYYQINSPDLALLVDRLRGPGGSAELVTTHRARDGWRYGATPHTWSIVDNGELVAWFLGQAR